MSAQGLRGPDEAPLRMGPLALAPTLELSNFGYDSNVFAQNEAADPESDFGATASPAVSAWLRLPGLNVSGRSEVDFVYFNELSHARSVDTVNAVSLEFFLARLRPYAYGNFGNTRHRRTLEIDAPVRRRDEGGGAGVELWLTGKTTVGVGVFRSRVRYDEDAVHFDNSLAQYLNRTSAGERVTLRYAVTPLTSVALEIDQRRDRFEFSPERDTDRLRIAPVVEFKPLALLAGRVAFGVQRSTSLVSEAPKAGGTFLYADVRYTLLGRTRIALEAERDIAYSYRVVETEYRQAGLTATVTHRLANPWDVRASVGRYRLTYLTYGIGPDGVALDAAEPTETVLRYGAGLGYLLGRTRLGVSVRYIDRDSELAIRREYRRLQVYSSLTYAFR